MQDGIFEIISLAIIIEAIITYINQFLVCGDFCWKMLLSIIFGIITSISYNIDIPKCLNLTSNIPYLGSILTGVLLSRGSNYVYDLISKVTKIN